MVTGVPVERRRSASGGVQAPPTPGSGVVAAPAAALTGMPAEGRARPIRRAGLIRTRMALLAAASPSGQVQAGDSCGPAAARSGTKHGLGELRAWAPLARPWTDL